MMRSTAEIPAPAAMRAAAAWVDSFGSASPRRGSHRSVHVTRGRRTRNQGSSSTSAKGRTETVVGKQITREEYTEDRPQTTDDRRQTRDDGGRGTVGPVRTPGPESEQFQKKE